MHRLQRPPPATRTLLTLPPRTVAGNSTTLYQMNAGESMPDSTASGDCGARSSRLHLGIVATSARARSKMMFT